MKLNKSIEQGIYVLLILALEKDHRPVKSRVLSGVLGVSDSFLKKLLMTMKNAGIITSDVSKNGGYQLARPITGISLKDVVEALDPATAPELSHLANSVFPDDPAHVQASEQLILAAFDRGVAAFNQKLDQFKLSQLLRPEAYKNGIIDWEKRLN